MIEGPFLTDDDDLVPEEDQDHRIKGLRNSSITRVRPFFTQLFERDPTGEAWLASLLASLPGSMRLPDEVRRSPGRLRGRLTEKRRYKDKISGEIELEHAFEYSVPPPTGFLRYLLQNPSSLAWPLKGGARRIYGEKTQRLRQALIDGPEPARQDAIREGLALLDERGAARSAREWWAFERSTEVDCYLETDRLVLFMEGKRTEPLSENTAWFRGRNQLVRNLEVIGEVAAGRACGVVLVTEEPTDDPTDLAYERSLPHLSSEQREEVRNRYLGQSTWRALCEATNISFESLPDERSL